jgi:ADP-ribose pyrophosphatase YjhB (NUDIX family)
MQNKDVYFVAVKVFLLDSQGNLLITKDRFGDWDIPGGRLRENDFDVSLTDVVERKIQEELGSGISYKLDEPAVFMRHERDEILSSGDREKKRIFAIGYRAEYMAGQLALGKNHVELKWVNLKTFKPEEYFTGGWLKGVKEFQAKNK